MNYKNLFFAIVLSIIGCGVLAAQGGQTAADKNKEIEKENAAISAALKAGNEAVAAKRYDEAIKIFDAAVKAYPKHPGVVTLLTNKSIAHRLLGVDTYNAALKSTDATTKSTGKALAFGQFLQAEGNAMLAVDEALRLANDPQYKNNTAPMRLALRARADARRLLVINDPTRVDSAALAFEEYIGFETDAEPRIKARVDLAQMLISVGEYMRGGVEAEKVVVIELVQNNADALFLAGTGLATGGTETPAKQRGVNYLKKFLTLAPANHRQRSDAQQVLDFMKESEGIVPK